MKWRAERYTRVIKKWNWEIKVNYVNVYIGELNGTYHLYTFATRIEKFLRNVIFISFI